MAIAREELERIAGLARLELSEDEAERLTRDCGAILDYFQTLRELALDDVADESPAGAAPLREDRAGADRLLRPLRELAPAWRDGFFVLPRLPAMDAGAGAGNGEQA
jgi:aspartyl-tRNA(Asn)/glutamyl-tRNA(Gln) amidotransferase subunit C